MTLHTAVQGQGVGSALLAAGVAVVHEIADEAFGRSLRLQDPDGLPLQINEHDPELYTR